MTRNLWRISGFNSLSGEGGLKYSARWHTAGHRIVYLAESPAGALIEHLVHLELNAKSWPGFYDLMQVSASDGMEVETLSLPAGDDWKRLPIVTRGLKHFHFYSAQSELSEVRLFLGKSRVGSGCSVDTRSENAAGDEWLRSKRTALARVPSAIMPATWNFLLNPDHPEAEEVRILEIVRADYDPRLFAQD